MRKVGKFFVVIVVLIFSSVVPTSINPYSVTVKACQKHNVQLPPPNEWPASTYNNMIANSFVSTGNTYRVMNAIEKSLRGEDVTIAFIGGSITEGKCASSYNECYVKQFYKQFKKRFGKGLGLNVHYVNAGIDGTSSDVGVIRYDRDVLKKCPSGPDIVFVDYAVNDNIDSTDGVAYESLIRNILKGDSNPACFLLFCVFENGWNMQDKYLPIGSYYDLPMVSIKNAVMPAIEAGTLNIDDFWSEDTLHPNDNGYDIMTDCIMYCFDQILAKGKDCNDITIPDAPVIGKDYENIISLDAVSKIEGIDIHPGSFHSMDLSLGAFPFNRLRLRYPHVWCHKEGEKDNRSFVMTANCSKLLLCYKIQPDQNVAGNVEVYIDGIYIKTISEYSMNAWNNAICVELFNDDTPADHIVEIRMAAGDEQNAFTLIGIGLVK